MSAFSIQVTYRKGKPFAACIYLAARPGQKSVRTREIGPDLVVDYAADGSALGIEIVSPCEVTVDEINRAFDELGLGRPSPSDLRPLRAA